MGSSSCLIREWIKLIDKERPTDKEIAILAIERKKTSWQCFKNSWFFSKFPQNRGVDVLECKNISESKTKGWRVSSKTEILKRNYLLTSVTIKINIGPVLGRC